MSNNLVPKITKPTNLCRINRSVRQEVSTNILVDWPSASLTSASALAAARLTTWRAYVQCLRRTPFENYPVTTTKPTILWAKDVSRPNETIPRIVHSHRGHVPSTSLHQASTGHFFHRRLALKADLANCCLINSAWKRCPAKALALGNIDS